MSRFHNSTSLSRSLVVGSDMRAAAGSSVARSLRAGQIVGYPKYLLAPAIENVLKGIHRGAVETPNQVRLVQPARQERAERLATPRLDEARAKVESRFRTVNRVPKTIGAAAGDRLTIKIEGSIGREFGAKGVSAAQVQRQLDGAANAKEILLIINSSGGTVGESRQIFEALRKHKAHKTAYVTGQCASAAFDILLAADWRECAPNARLLIHAPEIERKTTERWTREVHEAARNDLLNVETEQVRRFAARTGCSEKFFRDQMADERPLSVADAVKNGIIHIVRSA